MMMMSRRTFAAVIAAGALRVPGYVHAQPPGTSARIGVLVTFSSQSVLPLLTALRSGLREHGWIEGQNLHIEYSYDTPGGPSLDERAATLAKADLQLIVADSTPSSIALKRAKVTRPVVFTAVSEPVAIGIVDSLARPGHNFTGFTTVNRDLMPKRIELIKELAPAVKLLIYLGDPTYASHAHSAMEVSEVARTFGLRFEAEELRGAADFDAIAGRRDRLRDAFFVVEQSLFFIQHAEKMVTLERRTRIPAMYAHRSFVDRGGTICYGVTISELFRRAGGHIDRILRGARPGELPVEQPTKFELVLNLKTAKVLGLTIPPSLRLRADELIE